MKVIQINIYPIKSLRGISLPSATVLASGLDNDRRYILLKPKDDGTYKKLFVGDQPEMALFHCTLSADSECFAVSYRTPSPPITAPNPAQDTTLEVPFQVDTTGLKELRFKLNNVPDYSAYAMPEKYNEWFSACFGYEVILAYLGPNYGYPSTGAREEKWLSKLQSHGPYPTNITFSDGGALLVTSESSVETLHERFEDGSKVVHEKFRPNIIIDNPGKPWDEDFWGEIQSVRNGVTIVLTSNCARCRSINVDLEKGKMAEGESGKLLKKLMKDRRIDSGNQWEPIFGRYGFPLAGGELRLGDEIVVRRRNAEYDTWNGLVPRLTQLQEARVTV